MSLRLLISTTTSLSVSAALPRTSRPGVQVAEMATDLPVPETRVLAVASHVTYGYVGNTMAVPVMQALGCEVAALNTVNFSNHTGYKQFRGTRTSAQEISDIYKGLQEAFLDDFDVMLSGYIPGADAVEAVGKIARDLRSKSNTKPGSFFWVLDPVMGDEDHLYVAEDVIPAYKSLLSDADLILPNQFEAEILSGIKITSLSTIALAIAHLHKTYQIPHIIITSVRLPSTPIPSSASHSSPATSTTAASPPGTLSIIGSTSTSTHAPRLFHITVPLIADTFFSGTGDMFAALTVARLRQQAAVAGLLGTKSWKSPDELLKGEELPLARAAEMVLGSMQGILTRTRDAMERELSSGGGGLGGGGAGAGHGAEEGERNKRLHLKRTKAAEVRLVRNLGELTQPSEKFIARAWTEGGVDA